MYSERSNAYERLPAVSARRPYRETGLVSLDLANTWDPYLTDPERLPNLAALAAFLREHGIARTPGDDDLVACRSLRAALWHIAGAGTSRELAARLETFARGLEATPRLEHESGGWRLTVAPRSAASIADTLAVRALSELAHAVETLGPERIRTCEASPCQELFIDTSRNATRVYCSRRCANRVNAARHRRRAKS
jgi:predicted RNA-binding Zn ribbon-like protein